MNGADLADLGTRPGVRRAGRQGRAAALTPGQRRRKAPVGTMTARPGLLEMASDLCLSVRPDRDSNAGPTA